MLRPTDPPDEGGTVGSPYGSDIDNLATIQQVVADYRDDGLGGHGLSACAGHQCERPGLDERVHAQRSGLTNSATYVEQFLATTIAHEIGHTLSLVHIQGGAGNNYNIVGGSAPFDVMAYNYASNPALPTTRSSPASTPCLSA